MPRSHRAELASRCRCNDVTLPVVLVGLNEKTSQQLAIAHPNRRDVIIRSISDAHAFINSSRNVLTESFRVQRAGGMRCSLHTCKKMVPSGPRERRSQQVLTAAITYVHTRGITNKEDNWIAEPADDDQREQYRKTYGNLWRNGDFDEFGRCTNRFEIAELVCVNNGA